MSMCSGGIILPYLPELLEARTAEGFEAVAPLATAVEDAAKRVLSYQPQALVVVSPNGAAIEDAVTMHVQPRLKGSLASFSAEETVLGFETEHLLMCSIRRQSERLGVALEELTDDVLARHHLRGTLGREALVPLYYLRRAGFKGQIVHLNYGALPYEEMYTFGKAVRLAVEKAAKRTLLLAAVEVGEDTSDAVWYQALADALARKEVKGLLDLAARKPESMAARDLRALFFLMGGLSGLSFEEEQVQCSAAKGKKYWFGYFFRKA